jgi:hypothetical protein
MKKVAQMNSIFDAATILLLISYAAVQVLQLTHAQYMPLYLFVPLMALIRISLSGAGHYLIHRPQIGLNKLFTNVFDISYVSMAFVVNDHTLCIIPSVSVKLIVRKMCLLP